MITPVYSGLMDLALAIQPWRILWDLRISKAEKIGVALAMSMGILAACASFLKASSMPGLESPDFSCQYLYLRQPYQVSSIGHLLTVA